MRRVATFGLGVVLALAAGGVGRLMRLAGVPRGAYLTAARQWVAGLDFFAATGAPVRSAPGVKP